MTFRTATGALTVLVFGEHSRHDDVAEAKADNAFQGGTAEPGRSLRWACQAGHEWQALPNSVVQGAWCPKCAVMQNAAARRLSITDMKDFAQKRGGKCLSTTYHNIAIKLEWKCSKGHRWTATPNNTRRGEWCPICARISGGQKRRLTIEQNAASCGQAWRPMPLQNISRRECCPAVGVCRRTRWRAVPSSVKHGSWCLRCWRLRQGDACRLKIDTVKGLARARGGKLVSKEYTNAVPCYSGSVLRAIDGRRVKATLSRANGALPAAGYRPRRLGAGRDMVREGTEGGAKRPTPATAWRRSRPSARSRCPRPRCNAAHCDTRRRARRRAPAGRGRRFSTAMDF